MSQQSECLSLSTQGFSTRENGGKTVFLEPQSRPSLGPWPCLWTNISDFGSEVSVDSSVLLWPGEQVASPSGSVMLRAGGKSAWSCLWGKVSMEPGIQTLGKQGQYDRKWSGSWGVVRWSGRQTSLDGTNPVITSNSGKCWEEWKTLRRMVCLGEEIK